MRLLADRGQDSKYPGETLFERSDAIHAPKSDCMIRCVIKKARLVQVRSHGEGVNLPRADTCLHLESIKTQADIWTLPHIDQTTRAVFHLVSPGSELDPVPIISR